MVGATRGYFVRMAWIGVTMLMLSTLIAHPASGAAPPEETSTSDASAESTFEYPPLPDLKTPFVVGGFDATNPGWITALFLDGSYLCSASLIDPEVVLTAAHCVADLSIHPSRYTLVVGEEYLYASGISRTAARRRSAPQCGAR